MNAISPLIATVTLTKTGTIASTSSVSGSDVYWIRAIGVGFHQILILYQLAIHSAYDTRVLCSGVYACTVQSRYVYYSVFKRHTHIYLLIHRVANMFTLVQCVHVACTRSVL
jgi:hypothetical protein